jgi:hypothetical protein
MRGSQKAGVSDRNTGLFVFQKLQAPEPALRRVWQEGNLSQATPLPRLPVAVPGHFPERHGLAEAFPGHFPERHGPADAFPGHFPERHGPAEAFPGYFPERQGLADHSLAFFWPGKARGCVVLAIFKSRG